MFNRLARGLVGVTLSYRQETERVMEAVEDTVDGNHRLAKR